MRYVASTLLSVVAVAAIASLLISTAFAQSAPDAEVKLLPLIVEGEQAGLRVSWVSSDGRFFDLGIQVGELITEFNAQSLSEFGVVREMLRTLGSGETGFSLLVQSVDGSEREVWF